LDAHATDNEKLPDRLLNVVRDVTRGLVVEMGLEETLGASRRLSEQVMKEVDVETGDERLTKVLKGLGVRIIGLNFTTIDLYSGAVIPQSPDIFISSSSISGAGRAFIGGLVIDSSGSIQGTLQESFGIQAFRIDYTSRADFLAQ